MKVSLIFVRDKRFYSSPSIKFTRNRTRNPYPGNKTHYVFGEPPLGIMYLSAVLKQAGHRVSLFDQCHPHYSDESYVEVLQAEQPDMVGISFLSNMCYPAARTLSGKIKKALPNVRIVYGGVFSTINADRIIASEQSVDIVARGEGEDIILDLAQGPDRLQDIPGITFRSQTGEVVENQDRERIKDLDAIPFPDRSGLDIHYVASLPLDVPAVIWDRPYTTILSSRGCPFSCTYCNCPTFSRGKFSARSAENVLAELRKIEQLGYTSFSFLDDNFLLDTPRAKDICQGIIALGHDLRWGCEGRVDTTGSGLFTDLSAAGCDMILFGIESGSQRILDSMHKKTRIADIEDSVSRAKKAGIGIVHGFFIVGSPGETVEEVRQTFLLAERLSINSFNFNSLTAFRGTPLWNDAVARGLIDEESDWDKMFPVHEIYPDVIDKQTLFPLRSGLVKRLIKRKLLRNPGDAVRIIVRFLKCMSAQDLYRLLTSSTSDHTKKRV
jgi:radical SAM superfamily enzyme YgiQ (UPF0313 family)